MKKHSFAHCIAARQAPRALTRLCLGVMLLTGSWAFMAGQPARADEYEAGKTAKARAAAHDTHGAPAAKNGAKSAKAETEAVTETAEELAKRLQDVIRKNKGSYQRYTLTTLAPEPSKAPAAKSDHGAIRRVSAPASPVAAPDHAPVNVAMAAPSSGHGAAIVPTESQTSRQYIKARAAALAGHEAPTQADGHAGHGGEIHWAYEGENGPQSWGKLKSDFNTCSVGKRQSPIHIEESSTLPGPAEPLQISYKASSGSVVNNGHTIQVDLEGDNTLTVRGSVYKLVQFHFHHPAEEKVNYKGFAMVAHLVHKNAAGQLAVLAVLIDPGAASPLVEKVWTHMPLDVEDRVKLPPGLLNMSDLLPEDHRYYQFIGSLTTPPCTEGVLWLVLKQPVTVSRDQLKLFSQLFPNNARPTQALNGRMVREAQ